MPYGDRTGPAGAGPMTGRRMGYCTGFDRPGSMNPGRGFGFGMDRGGGFGGRGGGFGGHGRGWRNQFWATGIPGWARGGWDYGPGVHPTAYAAEIPPDDELKSLKKQYRFLERNLSDLKKRIAELEGANSE